MLCIALINNVPAAHSDLAAQLTSAALTTAAGALTKQLQRDVATWWPAATGDVVRVAQGPSCVGVDEDPFQILPTLPGVPGAIAYHDVNGTHPDAFLGLDTVTDMNGVTSAISHENCETVGDPLCDQWKTMPDGRQIALELCDPVQERFYVIDGVTVSDYVLPAYFDTSLTGPTTYGETIGMPRVEPFTLAPGGYMIVRNADGTETQVFGMHPRLGLVPGWVPKHKRNLHPTGRLFQRGVRESHLL